MDVKNKIIEEIRKIYDPELPVNIYELGLIYDRQVNGRKAEIKMTLTTPNCPVAESLPKEVNPNDELIEDKGVKVYIDSAAVMYLLGTEMDYKKEDFSSSFVFNNPNETERCGCGESFKV